MLQSAGWGTRDVAETLEKTCQKRDGLETALSVCASVLSQIWGLDFKSEQGWNSKGAGCCQNDPLAGSWEGSTYSFGS